MKKKYWASVIVNLDGQLEDIEAESKEEAKDKAYDIAKEMISNSTLVKGLRPFGVSVVCVGEENNESK